jgi:DNA (cytosine-5)-methyltransferase 1
MNELALFAGAGGGILAGKLLGWRTVCAVEINAYCAERLMQRQNEGHLAPFPIWDDVHTFDGRHWSGIIDVVSGGFPCQKFSNAHHGCATAQDLWPEMFRIIGEVESRFVFAENVKEAPIIAARKDLETLGYKCRHARFDAHFCGAPHSRERWWIVGDANPDSESDSAIDAKAFKLPVLRGSVWSEANLAESLRVDDGMADRMERLSAIGNGQVPEVARFAWETLTQ